MEYLISVIVCTYNQEDTIARTLDSVLAQRCHVPFEIVIGEDCSTDGTLAVCQTYAKQYPHIIRIIAHQHNKGIQDNYFDCLLECQGKYIADCAGDDFWIDPLKLEKEVRIMEADEHIMLVHTGWNYFDEKSGKTEIALNPYNPKKLSNGKQLLSTIITQTYFPVVHLCTSLYRRDAIIHAYNEDTELFRNKEYGCEDLQIVCALAHAGNIAYLPDITLNYSVNHTSISSSHDEKKQFVFVRKVTVLSFRLAEKYHINDSCLKPYFRYRIFALSMHAFRAKDKSLREEVQLLKKKWNVCPTMSYYIVQFAMINSTFWNFALAIRRLVVYFKK